jgi:ATPase subunit of ABC transporter with duplicated ATPase domains
MDVEAVIKFEDFLRSELQCATVIVSHDRELLDRVTDRTAILRDGRVRVFDAPCSRARVLLREADEADRRRWAAEQREVERLQAAADQLSHWAATFDNEKFAKRARSIERRIDKMELERTELSRERTAQVQCAPRRTESGLALRIEGLRLATPVGRALFSVPNLVVRRGERIAICGPNGAGKSTLLRELMATAAGARSVDSIRINPTVSIGYYDQELRHFRRGLTVLDAVGEVAATNRGKAGAILARAGFMFERQNTPIELLSGGEQARLTFLAMELSRPSLLILDEPTNHLDLDGIERLEESLVSAEGSCLFVSHDRRFVERVATRVLSVREGVLGEWGAT